jgi:DNA-binding NarL/FixJ family response regulator
MTTLATAESSTAEKVARIFLVDDHPLFRHGLARFIEAEPGYEICGEASSVPRALEALRKTDADVAIIDISLPGANGLELIKHLKVEHPDLAILVVSAHDEQLYALRALRAGASGYVMKKEAESIFLLALQKVVTGGVYVSPAFGDQLIYKVARNEGGNSASPLDVLSDREMEVLQLIGESKPTKQIAAELNLSVKTVESHRLHIKEKLGLSTSTDLVRFALDFVAQQTG